MKSSFHMARNIPGSEEEVHNIHQVTLRALGRTYSDNEATQKTGNIQNNTQQTQVDILWDISYHTIVNVDANCNIFLEMGVPVAKHHFYMNAKKDMAFMIHLNLRSIISV